MKTKKMLRQFFSSLLQDYVANLQRLCVKYISKGKTFGKFLSSDLTVFTNMLG